jgi:hypothetical protein
MFSIGTEFSVSNVSEISKVSDFKGSLALPGLGIDLRRNS